MDNTVTWFEVATDDPAGVERFYGDLFGWTFAPADGPIDYRTISYPGGGQPAGGLYNTEGRFPNHALFHVQVPDVAAACARSESLGGKVVFQEIGGEGPGTDFAYVSDTSGNLFGIFHQRS
ncbi:VOC family protein [Nonomuraea sp. NPDC050328]|uniref:VOC family protein n=1 Tax=Nonomuraea sp. NPDC050328 TaxID=3364361 RepID=UPI0037A284B1